MEANKWLLFLVIAVILWYTRPQYRDAKKCIFAVTVILTCFSGLRSWQMGDVYHYCYAYVATNSPGWTLQSVTSGDTIGLQLFFKAAGLLGISFEVCLFLIAALVAGALGILVYRYSPSPFWSYVIYLAMGFYIFTLSGLKQAIAMAFIIFAMMAVFQRRPLQFLVWVSIATLFHTPAMVFLIVYPWANKKVDISYVLIVLVGLFLIFRFRNEIMKTMMDFYYEDEIAFEAQGVIGFKVVFMVIIMIAALVFRPLRKHDVIYRQVFNVMLIAAVVQSFSVYDNVFTRLADYFYQFVVLFIPMMLEPGSEQAERYPNHRKKIRYWTPRTTMFIQAGVLMFSVWYYFKQVEGSAALLDGFSFFWEVEGKSSLEMVAEAWNNYGG